MSKINAIRLVNLNYNYNTIRVDDEYFELDGENSLFSLINGGGKSVIVQMITAPFVHRHFRNAVKRPFSDFFTTNKPTFILVEWKLDGGAGYVLTGMMIRKNQDADIDIKDKRYELDTRTFIYEYKTPNVNDIRNLPIIENENETKKLKGFQTCEKMFEELKIKKGNIFNYYNLNNPPQQKSYFEKLEQYQIYYSEWESIIKKINEKESGLSELFATAQNEKGLVEKWFLKAIEDKLNKNGERAKEFESIMSKCIKSYKDNHSKLEKKDCILSFKKETESIYTNASKYQNVIIEKHMLENRIGSLMLKLEELKETAKIEIDNLKDKIYKAKNSIDELRYQEESLKVMQKKETFLIVSKELEIIKSQLIELEDEKFSTNKLQNILKCAKIYKQYLENDKEVEKYQARLETLKKQDMDLTPRREQLGYTLKCHYEKESADYEILILQILEEIKNFDSEILKILSKLQGHRKFQEQDNKELGKLEEQIKSFSNEEERFNDVYNKKLSRNLLGMYEEGMLEHLEISYKDENNKIKQNITNTKREKYDADEKFQKSNLEIEECQSKLGELSADIKNLLEKDTLYEKQLDERKIAVRYINISDADIFDCNKIDEEFNKKIEEIERIKSSKDRELEDLNKEYKNLETGKVLELSIEIEEALNMAGIRYVYGMDWLKQNGDTQAKNEKLLLNNPLIPYSIIMSSSDIKKLENCNIQIFTSSPIPIVIKESLDYQGKQDIFTSSVISIDHNLYFYVLFNQELLDSEKLALLLDTKKAEIENLKEIINKRALEIKFYNEKRHLIKNQTISLDAYKACKNQIEKTRSEITSYEKRKNVLRESAEKHKKQSKELTDNLIKLTDLLKSSDYMLSDFKLLFDEYNDYLERLDEKLYLTKQIDNREKEIATLNAEQNNMRDLKKAKEEEKFHKNEKLSAIQAKKNIYASYKENTIADEKIEKIEIEFKSITESINSNQLQLEESITTAQNNLDKIKKDLNNAVLKYSVADAEYKSLEYDSYHEDALEKKQKDLDKIIRQIQEEEKSKLKEHTKLDADINNDLRRISEEFGYDDILSKDRIVVVDFKKEILELKIEKESNEKFLKIQTDIFSIYENNLGFLAEYKEFEQTGANELEENIKNFTKNQLDNFRGSLIRDYNAKKDDEIKERQNLSEEIIRIMNNDSFKDDFYQNPLKRLYECRTIPIRVIEQLDLNWKSYTMLLDKLQVDIEKLEDEKARIVDIFTDYIHDIHKNLNMIDSNSSINVRNRSIKMLKIKQPIWEDEEIIYTMRIRDFVDGLINSGIDLLEKNEQVEEMLGKHITTCNLYDTIVGCSKVEIKLYKIEAQKEIPITWAEAAKNSGGEGFLSAFVILSSLMMYLRRDETDIFLEKEEGKVLIMDNPFAQTNADHLLVPLMDIAKKSNTQLICLTGLGGDSIYNRFDNIYVLNQVISKLQSGVRFLKSEHAKGEENMKNVVSSHILAQEVEQLKLF